jgi:hypothetical protein
MWKLSVVVATSNDLCVENLLVLAVGKLFIVNPSGMKTPAVLDVKYGISNGQISVVRSGFAQPYVCDQHPTPQFGSLVM